MPDGSGERPDRCRGLLPRQAGAAHGALAHALVTGGDEGAIDEAAAERLVESTRLSSEAAQEGFELGVVTNVDVLNALRDQFQAERDLQRARYEQINYLLMLKREAGSLNADDILEINRLMVPPDG